MSMSQAGSDHFGEQTPLEHVAQRRAQGIKETAEVHGTEIPGHISAGADATREMAVVLLILWVVTLTLSLSPAMQLALLGLVGLGYTVWKIGRSAWLGWSRLERLHRIIEQERWEIEHHRTQERAELVALYQAKGFEGRLLDEVVDVLMADNDRLLRVMLEEELGLVLQGYEHPLKQSVGAAFGAILTLAFCWGLAAWFPLFGVPIGSTIALLTAATISARSDGNRLLPAIVWHVALAGLALGVTYFLIEWFV